MAKKRTKINIQKSFYDVLDSVRGDWGNVKPYTRIFKDETKEIPRKQKYRNNYDENQE